MLSVKANRNKIPTSFHFSCVAILSSKLFFWFTTFIHLNFLDFILIFQMKPKKCFETENDVNSLWNDCPIDIWFVIAKYLRPNDTLVFGLICKKTRAVVDSEAFWNGIFNRCIRSKYPWLDRPSSSDGSSELKQFQIQPILNLFLIFLGIRDETIRELFKNCPPFCSRKIDPDSYDKVTNKTCLRITHNFNEKLSFRSYLFKVQSRFTNYGRLAKQNYQEGCQLLLVRTNQHFVPVPYETDNLVIKSISKNLSRGFRAYKLKIEFCDKFGNLAGETLVFDPIVGMQLYDWWEPNYDKLLNNKS